VSAAPPSDRALVRRTPVTQLNDDPRQKLKGQVQRVAAATNISENVLEIVQKMLAA
jgi:hypothetical protein